MIHLLTFCKWDDCSDSVILVEAKDQTHIGQESKEENILLNDSHET